VLCFISPLLKLVTETGPDERQLSDKARGILTSRIGKLKTVPASIHPKPVLRSLEDLHARARRNHTLDLATALSQCSLYVSNVLCRSGWAESVILIYRDSIMDFAVRKASTLNISFFQDFIRRYPLHGWDLRNTFVDVSTRAINAYRQCQIFQLVHTVLNQVPATVRDCCPQDSLDTNPSTARTCK
jgi:DNA polymerase phi